MKYTLNHEKILSIECRFIHAHMLDFGAVKFNEMAVYTSKQQEHCSPCGYVTSEWQMCCELVKQRKSIYFKTICKHGEKNPDVDDNNTFKKSKTISSFKYEFLLGI